MKKIGKFLGLGIIGLMIGSVIYTLISQNIEDIYEFDDRIYY